MSLERRGRLFLISAPSGAGKTSLVREVTADNKALAVSISSTTRQRRPCERHGRDYWFVSEAEFAQRLADGRFLEHARVFDNYYGTDRQWVERKLADHVNVLLEIDWQGARQVRLAMPESFGIFLLPPSRAELERRLRRRGTDSDAIIAQRLRAAKQEMSHWNEYDAIVVNDNFDHARKVLDDLVHDPAPMTRADRNHLRPLIDELLR
jgi:guanylate kinase